MPTKRTIYVLIHEYHPPCEDCGKEGDREMAVVGTYVSEELAAAAAVSVPARSHRTTGWIKSAPDDLAPEGCIDVWRGAYRDPIGDAWDEALYCQPHELHG